jgi:hypothetical protein
LQNLRINHGLHGFTQSKTACRLLHTQRSQLLAPLPHAFL